MTSQEQTVIIYHRLMVLLTAQVAILLLKKLLHNEIISFVTDHTREQQSCVLCHLLLLMVQYVRL